MSVSFRIREACGLLKSSAAQDADEYEFVTRDGELTN